MVRCLFHPDKTPSMSIDTERGLFHCFGCGIGGGVRKFAELLGEKWANPRSESRMARADGIARARAREAHVSRERAKFNSLIEQYRELEAEREVAEFADRVIDRCPNLLTPAEQASWTDRLHWLYDNLEWLAMELDVFTDERHKAERFALLRAEQKRVEAA